MNKDTQNNNILRYLQGGGRLTGLKALQLFGCIYLPARIYDLRQKHYSISSERTKLHNGKIVNTYFL